MPTAEYDLRYLREALESLESFLLADELFWNLPVQPPPGEPAYPALTLGGVLLSRSRLAALNLGAAEYTQFRSLSLQLDALLSRWRTAWERKALRSFKSRLAQWANFIEDYRKHPDAHVDRYVYEVRLRLMLDLLAVDLPEVPEEQAQLLKSLDSILSQVLEGSDFVWGKAYRDGFPRQKYWYLYGRLKEGLEPV
jgi:hypothetical protein